MTLRPQYHFDDSGLVPFRVPHHELRGPRAQSMYQRKPIVNRTTLIVRSACRKSDRTAGGRSPRSVRLGASVGALALLVALGQVAGPAAVAAADQDSPSEPAGYSGSRWWPRVEEVDASLREEKWRRGLRRAEQVLDEVVRRSWEEPDLQKVLAMLSAQRAVAEAALGREEAALWHWHTALNLDPSVKSTLDDYGEAAELLRDNPLRRRGHLPDGTVPPPRFATPGYEPVAVIRPPTTGLFENASVRDERVPPVSLELVVGEDGRLRYPVVTSPWVHPVVLYWTLDQCFSVDYEIRPARIDGRPIEELEEIEMEFETTDRW